jgi:hypothetical protein
LPAARSAPARTPQRNADICIGRNANASTIPASTIQLNNRVAHTYALPNPFQITPDLQRVAQPDALYASMNSAIPQHVTSVRQ